MKLSKDERLQATESVIHRNPAVAKASERNRSIYVVGELIQEDAFFAFYTAAKVFRNAHKSSGKVEEASHQESLRVVLKVINYCDLSDRAAIQSRRKSLIDEARSVLGVKATNLLPEPIDLLFVINNHDRFQCPRSRELIEQEPVLVQEAVSGTSIDTWRSQRSRSLLDCLMVGFEILRFAEVMHTNGLFVHSFHPEAFRIDEERRIHFLAADTVLTANSHPRSVCDRIPKGWCDSTAMHLVERCDSRLDLFAWASLAYFLVTGEKPPNTISSTSLTNPVFNSSYRSRFLAMLEKLTATDEIVLAKTIGVDRNRLRGRLMDNLTNVVFTCLDPRVDLRPGAASVVKSWLEKPPPQPIPMALILKGEKQLLALVIASSSSSPKVCIREQLNSPPNTGNEGVPVYEGFAGQSVVSLSRRKRNWSGHERFSTFTIEDDGSGSHHYSVAVNTPLLDLDNLESSLPIMKSVFGNGKASGSEFGIRKALIAARHFPLRNSLNSALFTSDDVTQRMVALDLISDAAQGGWSNEADFALLRNNGLSDRRIQIRYKSASIILQHSTVDEEFLAEIANRVGSNNIRLSLRVLSALPVTNLKNSCVASAKRAIVSGESEDCPECGKTLSVEELDDHLVKEHAYVIDMFACLPLRQALAQWWEQFLCEGDIDAGKCLAKHLHSDERLGNALVAQVERIWLPRSMKLSGQDHSVDRERIVGLLSCPEWVKASRYLIQSKTQACREIGRSILIPKYAAHFSTPKASLETFLKTIRFLAGSESHDVHRLAVNEMAKYGALASLAYEALKELERTKIMPCAVCGKGIGNHLLAKHKRLAHKIFEHEGKPTTLDGYLQAQISALLGANPQLSFVDNYLEVANEQFRDQDIIKLFMLSFGESIKFYMNSWSSHRSGIVGSTIAQCMRAQDLAIAFIQNEEMLLNEIGLHAITHMESGLDSKFIGVLGSALERPNLSKTLARQVLERVLPRANPSDRDLLLRAYVKTESDRLDQLQRLQSLRETVGSLWEIELICDELEDLMRIRCPVCDVVFSGKEIGTHVETEHGRVWEGRRVRPAWTMAIETMIEYSDSPKAELLSKAEHYAGICGGHDAVTKLRRIACSKGWADGVYLPILKKTAGEHQASLCPKCFGEVRAPLAPQAMPLSVSKNSIQSDFASISAETYFPLSFIHLNVSDSGRVEADDYTRISAASGYGFIGLFAAIGSLLGFFILQRNSIGGLIFLLLFSLVVFVIAFAFKTFRFSGLSHLFDILWDEVITEKLKQKQNPLFEAFLIGYLSHTAIEPERRLQMLRQIEPFLWNDNDENALQEKTRCCILQQYLRSAVKGSDHQGVFRIINRLVDRWFGGLCSTSFVESVTHNGQFVETLPEPQRRHLAWSLIKTAFLFGVGPDDFTFVKERSHLCKTILDPRFSPTLQTMRMARALFDGDGRAIIENSGGYTVFQAIGNERTGSIRPFDHMSDLLFFLPDGSLIARERGMYWGQSFVSPETSIKVNRSYRQFIQTGWLHQRVDGGPDRRYNHNPPVGYWTEDGWYVTIGNAKPILMRSDPSKILNCIEQWKTTYYRLQQFARKTMHGSLDHLNRILQAESLSTCPECGCKQSYALGGVGRARA